MFFGAVWAGGEEDAFGRDGACEDVMAGHGGEKRMGVEELNCDA